MHLLERERTKFAAKALEARNRPGFHTEIADFSRSGPQVWGYWPTVSAACDTLLWQPRKLIELGKNIRLVSSDSQSSFSGSKAHISSYTEEVVFTHIFKDEFKVGK